MKHSVIAVGLILACGLAMAETAEQRLDKSELASRVASIRVCNALNAVNESSASSSAEVIELREALIAGREIGPTALSKAYDSTLEALEAPEVKYAVASMTALRALIGCKPKQAAAEVKTPKTSCKAFAEDHDYNRTELPFTDVKVIPYDDGRTLAIHTSAEIRGTSKKIYSLGANENLERSSAHISFGILHPNVLEEIAFSRVNFGAHPQETTILIKGEKNISALKVICGSQDSALYRK